MQFGLDRRVDHARTDAHDETAEQRLVDRRLRGRRSRRRWLRGTRLQRRDADAAVKPSKRDAAIALGDKPPIDACILGYVDEVESEDAPGGPMRLRQRYETEE